MSNIAPFTIHVPDEVLSDLKTRIRNTRWPSQAPDAAWSQGTDLEYLKRLLSYWANDFDWRTQERQLNTFKHFRAELGLRRRRICLTPYGMQAQVRRTSAIDCQRSYDSSAQVRPVRRTLIEAEAADWIPKGHPLQIIVGEDFFDAPT